MAITYTLDDPARRMHTRAEGLVTRADVEAHLDVEERDRALDYAELVDARGARIDLTPEDVRRLVERARQARAAGTIVGPTAIVADSDVVFGMARMYAMLGEFSHIPVEVFREMPPAVAWLDAFGRGAGPGAGE